jgi:triacylglycerol esterase/lipase EstA (alpha/beta hydrolase family)
MTRQAVTAIQGWANSIDALWNGQAPAKKPVIIVAGTLQAAGVYEPLAAKLRASGHQVYIYELPNRGRGDIANSAAGLAAFADTVRATTGADKVDLVGHSQGGLVARQYVKFNGGADHVRNLIGLGTPNRGTLTALLPSALGVGKDGAVAFDQMVPGSDFLKALNEGDDTIGDVRYTSFYTNEDLIVVPVESATLNDGATNVRIQDQLPDNRVGHQRMPFDPAVQNGIEDALRGEPVDLTK